MPATTPRQFRLTKAELAQIDELAKLWGGSVKSMHRTEVVREAVRRALESETRKKKKISKNLTDGS